MLINGNELTQKKNDRADICIVGGGAAGIVLANELKDYPGKVILVEGGDVNYSGESQELYKAESKNDHFPDPMYSRLRFMGGSTNHWENNTAPFDPIDFDYRDWVKNSGWPISFDDLKAHYVRAQYYCGVNQDGYELDYWTKKLGFKDIWQGSDVCQSKIAKYAVMPSRFYANHGASLNVQENLTIYSNSNLVGISYSESSKQVDKINCVNHEGIELNIEAKSFVIGLGGIENARVLLDFNEHYNDKIGNQGGAVGCYFMEHPTVRALHLSSNEQQRFKLYEQHQAQDKYVMGYSGLTDKILEKHATTNIRVPFIKASQFELSDGISSSHILKNIFTKGDWPEGTGSHLFNVISDIDMVIEGIARKSFDERVFDHADDFGGFSTVVMIEQTPDKSNRIMLGDTKDRLGKKRVKIALTETDTDKTMAWKSLNILAQEFGAQNLGRARILTNRASRVWGSQLGYSQHHMGTTRMSESPENGVVDADCRVFGTNNLYMAGSSVFPTGGHVPPTLTICAMSVRLAKYLESEVKPS